MQGEPGMGYVWGAIPAQYGHAFLMLLTAAALMLMPLGHAREMEQRRRGC